MTVMRPQLTGTFGAVASTHWLASAVGMGILDRGGNAFDAATAAGFTLQVVEPHSNGPGGDVVISVYPRSTGTVRVICGQGPMPQAATIDQFAALGIQQMPAAGLLPATVPGAFGAWMRLLAEFGTMPLATVLEPAIGYASLGYPLLPGAASTIAAMAPLFRTEWTGSGRAYLPDGAVPAAGSRLRNATLAQHLRTAGSRGPGRVDRPGSPDRGGSLRLLRGLRRRGDRPLRGYHRGVRLDRPAALRPADRPGPGDLAAGRRGAVRTAVRRLHRPQAGALVAGSGLPAAAGEYSRAATCAAWDWAASSTSIPSRRRPSSRSPTARPGTGTRRTRRCRWPNSWRRPTPRGGAR